ncbi:MAG: hypothetical protein CME06_12700 [Gemmatimonadetes bacterium]|nr:hypothetical protein [Gemmatimonadota bacterium]
MTRSVRIVLLAAGLSSAALGDDSPPIRPAIDAGIDTWDALDPMMQIEREALVIPWGTGTAFVPAMTDPDYEPPYSIYRDGAMVQVQRTGHSAVLEPGEYELRWGSGDLTQRMRRSLRVGKGHVTVLEPDWSSLVVEVIDETRTTVGYSYEVVQLPAYASFGVGRSAEEALGERQLTWVLPAGLYKILPVGEDYSSIVNFATVRLLPGELTRLSVVIDDVSGNFLGAGTLALSRSQRGRTSRTYAAGHANLLFDHQHGGAEGVSRQDLSFSGTAELRHSYEGEQYTLSIRGLGEEGLSRVPELGWRIITDRFLARAVAVRKLRSRVGLYARLLLENKLFPGRVYLDDPTEFIKIDRNLRPVDHGLSDEIEISPGGLPLTLQEGVGVNLIALKSERSSLFLRTGYGFRQTINRSVFGAAENTQALRDAVGADTLLTTPSNANLYTELESVGLYGFEESLIFEGRLGRRIILGAEADLLIPQGGGRNIIDAEGTVNLRLSKGLSLYYSLRYLDDSAIADEPLVDGSARLRFSYVF